MSQPRSTAAPTAVPEGHGHVFWATSRVRHLGPVVVVAIILGQAALWFLARPAGEDTASYVGQLASPHLSGAVVAPQVSRRHMSDRNSDLQLAVAQT